MKRSDFHYVLPAELIAERPPAQRRDSRLLCLDGNSGTLRDRQFAELPELLQPGDLLVVNDTRVLNARLYAWKPTGGRIECLVERLLDERKAMVRLRGASGVRSGMRLRFEGGFAAVVVERQAESFLLRLDPEQGFATLMERHGHVPLPPYIRRGDEPLDRERYQTVFAARPGAIAAPTAGLHLDEAMLEELAARGVDRVAITLHVGAGTFAPMRVDAVSEHRLHFEWVQVSEAACAAIRETRARNGRVIAVGTTVVRALEAAALAAGAAPGESRIEAYSGETDLFIHPGFRFRVVDRLITNFHLPESTLLMLVSAFSGREHVLAAYRHAVQQRYRFFSYGDAMLLDPCGSAPA